MNKKIPDLEKIFFKNLQNICSFEDSGVPFVLIVSASGGIDSMCLLALMLKTSEMSSEIFSGLKPEIRVCHCRHGLRGVESQADFEFVRQTALKKNLKFYDLDCVVEHGPSLQVRAREKRYQAFADLHKSICDKERIPKDRVYILLGHNEDDQCETLLFRLFRGTGPAGLTGIPKSRGIFLRPMLNIKRQEIREYALNQGIVWREDSSNSTIGYSRNKLRNIIIPEIEKLTEMEVKSHISALSQEIACWKNIVESSFEKLLNKALIIKPSEESIVMKMDVVKDYIHDEYRSLDEAQQFISAFFSWLLKRVEICSVGNKISDMSDFIFRHYSIMSHGAVKSRPGAYLNIGVSSLNGEYILRIHKKSLFLGPASDHPFCAKDISSECIKGPGIFNERTPRRLKEFSKGEFHDFKVGSLQISVIKSDSGELLPDQVKSSVNIKCSISFEKPVVFSLPEEISSDALVIRSWRPGDVIQEYKCSKLKKSDKDTVKTEKQGFRNNMYRPAGKKKFKKKLNSSGLDPVVKAFIPVLAYENIIVWYPGSFTKEDKASQALFCAHKKSGGPLVDKKGLCFLLKWIPERLFYEI